MNLKLLEPSILTPCMIRDLKALAMKGYPYEICGVIHQHGIIHQYTNTFAGDHSHGFDMELDVEDPTIRAIWHTHPNGPTVPSPDDLPCMESLASHGYNFPWLIVTPRTVTEWICEGVALIKRVQRP